MKKLLLVLSAIFVSVMGYSQARTTLNPYAYDLRTTWKSERVLNFSFKLNSHPNLSGTYGNSTGIMLKLIAPDGTVYRAIPVSSADIYSNSKFTKEYSFDLDFDKYQNKYGEYRFDGIPANVDIAWQVDVAGESSNKGRTSPIITCFRPAWRPCMPHGVAIGKGFNGYDGRESNFGKIFVADNANSNDLTTYGFTWRQEEKANSLIEYVPMLLADPSATPQNIASFHKKSNQNGSSVGNFSHPEPHRVRISEDGRIFVTSYHPNSSTSVWEYKGNGRFDRLIEHANKSTDQINTNRIVAMDVKGSGSNLKLLLCEIDPTGNTYNSQNYSKLIIREYAIGTSTNLRTVESGTIKVYYNDYRTDKNLQGMIYQSYTPETDWQGMRTDGMINIAYGKAANSIWLKMDFGSSQVMPRIVYFDGTNNCGNYYDTGSSTYSGMRGTALKEKYGSSGILVHGRDTLITAYPDKISFYTYNSSGQLTWKSDLSTIKDGEKGTGQKVNDFAIDAANNLYAVSSRNYSGYGEAGKYYGFNLMVISLPYSGLTTTNAPDKYKFKVPYPASNLQYAPVEGKNQYKFTFNVDATPRTVDVRFYTTKEQMLKGGDDYAFHYSAFKTAIKGTMSITFDAVNGTITDKELEDTDENKNGILNLPPGEYYWCVCVNGTATPASDSYCFVPERISQDMNSSKMANVRNQYEDEGYNLSDIAIYRPMKAGQYNTLCLPFTVDLNLLADNHPYKIGDVFSFSGINYTTSINAGEDMLELLFEKTTTITTYKPYLFAPKEDITTIQSLGTSITFNEVVGLSDPQYQTEKHNFTDKEGENSINFWSVMYKVTGLYPEDGEVCLILVDKNRLAQVLNKGDMLGFRAFFSLKRLSAGTQVGIAERKPTPTSIIDLNGTQVDVEKFMREGRVYIRLGESLYTLSGERVE